MKFISLNIVSFLEGIHLERLQGLPVYLIRDLENFIKLEDIEKFIWFDMRAIEEAAYEQNCKSEQKREVISSEFCYEKYSNIIELFS